MGLKGTLVKPFASLTARKINRDAEQAIPHQHAILKQLVKTAQNTAFGKDHHFHKIKTYQDFKQAVPIRGYEALRPYFDQVKDGKSDILWPGQPKYFAKTSGTTSGVKYIPLTKQSIPNHFGSARNMVFNYIAKTGKTKFMDGKMIFLSGSPELTTTNGVLTGRLSGISNHMIPGWLKASQMPSYETNCIEDWETKLDRIVEETVKVDMTMISGIPPWVQMYYERLLEFTGKSTVLDVFPNFSLFAYGGVNYEPYRAKLEELVGGRIDSLETYPASEGFIAFQDRQDDLSLLLNSNSGIFYEFVPVDEIFKASPKRYCIEEVETGVNYAVIINSNAGLWGYSIGDTVRFTSVQPYRLLVTGRVKHFISAFGEHVIGKEVEEALLSVCKEEGVAVVEFTVAPQINPPEGGVAYHEWLIEFDRAPKDLTAFALKIDKEMIRQNIYYKDLIDGNILQPLKIKALAQNAFRDYMKSQGKLGGQNKVPRLSNDRKIADLLLGASL